MTVPDCGLGSGAGVIFFRVGIDAGLEGSKIRNPEFLELSLSAKALAVTNVAGASEFVYRARTGLGSDLQRAVLQENAFASGITPTPMLFNGAEGDYVAVAGTDQIRAFIAPVSSVEQIVVQISSPLEAIDSTGGVNKGQLITLPIGGPVTATAWDDRVAVATTTAGELTWLIANTDREVVARDTLPGVTAISSAALNDHLFIAGASTSRIRIARVDGVRGADPSFAQAVELEPEQLPTLNDYTGQWIATAAGANRVALLWLAHNPDAPTSAPGGWALLECQN